MIEEVWEAFFWFRNLNTKKEKVVAAQAVWETSIANKFLDIGPTLAPRVLRPHALHSEAGILDDELEQIRTVFQIVSVGGSVFAVEVEICVAPASKGS